MNTQILFSPIELGDLEKLIQKSVMAAVENLIPKDAPIKDICNLDDAEIITGLKKSAIYGLTMRKGRDMEPDPIPFMKYGKSLRFKRSELEAWVNRRMVSNNHSNNQALMLAEQANRNLNRKFNKQA